MRLALATSSRKVHGLISYAERTASGPCLSRAARNLYQYSLTSRPFWSFFPLSGRAASSSSGLGNKLRTGTVEMSVRDRFAIRMGTSELAFHSFPRGDGLAHHPHANVIVTEAHLKIGDTTLVPLQPVLGRKAAFAQGDVVDIALDLGVKVGVLDLLAVGAVVVDLRLDFRVAVPFHDAHEDVSLDLAAVVTHELLGSPADVLGLTVGRHLLHGADGIEWSQIGGALKLSV